MPTYVYECSVHGRTEIVKPMAEAGRPAYCPTCLIEQRTKQRRPGEFDGLTWQQAIDRIFEELSPMRRVYTPPPKPIIRPSGYRLSPEDPKFSDFRREMELGELREDATPVALSPSELAAWDNPPIAIPPDPERDYRLAQAVRQNWTEDLSPGVAYNRELAAKAAREHAEART